MSLNNKHALIIGGTGMLKMASLAIVEQFENTTLIARNLDRLEHIATNTKNKTHLVSLDYTNTHNLKNELKTITNKYSKFDLAIIWIHSTSAQAPYIAAKFVEGDYYHVLSSSYTDPSRDNSQRLEKFKTYPNINYHEVILGFITDTNYPRWLNHSEISSGVVTAIKEKQKRFIVGSVSPWSARP